MVPESSVSNLCDRSCVLAIAVTLAVVLLAAASGVVVADTTEEWTHTEHEGDPVAVTAYDGLIISGDDTGEVLAYDPATETVEWRTDTGATDDIYDLGVIDGTVVAASRDGTVVGLEPADGSEQWTRTYNQVFSMATTDDTAYLGLEDGAAAIDADGDELWNRQPYDTDEYGAAQGIDATADESGSVTVILGVEPGGEGVENGLVLGYDPDADATRYAHTNHTGNVRDTLFHDGVVYSAGGMDDARVVAFDPDADAILYEHDAHTDVAHHLAAQGDHVLSVGGGGDLVRLDTTDRSTTTEATPHAHSFHVALADGIAYTTGGTAAGDGTVTATNTTLDPEPNVRVVDESGEPVAGATVEWYGVVTADAEDVTTIEDAEALLDEAADPEPPAWEPDQDLAGSNGLFANADAEYVAVHSAGAWGFGGPTDFNDLSEPTLTPDAEQDLVLTVWDPAGEGFIQDDVDRHLPGETVERDVTVEHLAPGDGEVVETETYTAEGVYEFGPGVPAVGKTHYGVRLSLPAGFYRVSPEGSEVSYVIMVGDPVAMIEQDLRDEADSLTDSAADTQDRLADGTFVRETVRTDASGAAHVDVPEGVDVVTIQAYRADGALDVTDPTPADLRDLDADYDAALHVSTHPTVVESDALADAHAGDSDLVTVETRRVGGAPYDDFEAFAERLADLAEQHLDAALADLDSVFADLPGDLDSDVIAERADALEQLAESNDALADALDRLAADPDDPEYDELVAAVDDLRADLDVTDREFDVSDGTLDGEVRFAEPVDAEATAVIVRYADGDAAVLDADEWSVSEDGSLAGALPDVSGSAGVVSIDDAPVRTDAPVVDVEVVTESVDGTPGRAQAPVAPDAAPDIAAVDVSTLRPGPDESVSLRLIPADSADDYAGIERATVYDPDGVQRSVDVAADGTVSFSTVGEGTHVVRVVYADTTGAEYGHTIRLAAGDGTSTPTPTLDVRSGPSGPYVLAGDGFERGSVEETADGLVVRGVAPGDDAPSTAHVRLADPTLAEDLSVELRHGDDERLNQHVSVTVHTRLSADTLLRRGSAPITRDGDTRYGEVQTRETTTGGEKQLIRTYTDAAGDVTIDVTAHPGIVDRVRHAVRVRAPVGLPVLSVVGSVGPVGFV